MRVSAPLGAGFAIHIEHPDMLSDINARNEYGETPLHIAASRRNVNRARTLISDGADVNAENDDGETPLHYAALEGNTSMARMLVKAGADVNAKDKRGRTALHCVAWEGYTHTARALITLGARVNTKDTYGHTPLHYAQLENDGEMERTLIDAEAAQKSIAKGTDTHTEYRGVETPLDQTGHVEDAGGNKSQLENDGEMADANRRENAYAAAEDRCDEIPPEWTGHIENGRCEKSPKTDSGCGLAIAAIAVALIGAYFLIDNFGIWGFVWRSALIIPGLWFAADDTASDSQLWFGIALIGGGVFFTLITLDTTPGWIIGIIWAVALIIVSALIISRQRQRR